MSSIPDRRASKVARSDLTVGSYENHRAPDEPCAVSLDEVYRAESRKLERFFDRRRPWLPDGDDPLDFVHEAFVRLAKWMSTNPVRQPGPYLQRIARNLLVDRARKARTRGVSDYVPLADDLPLLVPPDQAHRLEEEDLMDAYRRALDELPARTREAFLLHRVDELTYKEIGERLEISIPTVQYHVARALAHLDAALGQE